MARLVNGKVKSSNQEAAIGEEHWNSPANVSTPASQKLMPPPVRPSERVDSKRPGGVNSSDTASSSKKKPRRSRGKKKLGRDSFSENATTISEDTTTATANDRSSPLNAQSRASPRGTRLLPSISQEEQPVFDQEPEMFGVYASSSDEEGGNRKQLVNGRSDRVQTYSPSVAEPAEKDVDDSVGVEKQLEAPPATNRAVPAPEKLANGRFACPLKEVSSCDKTFADVKSAKRHADLHLNAERYDCEHCGKTFARKDSYTRHCDGHVKATKSSAKQAQNTKSTVAKESVDDGIPGKEGIDDAGDEAIEHVRAVPESHGELPEAKYPIIPRNLVPPKPASEVTSAESESETEQEDDSADGTTDTATSRPNVELSDAMDEATASESDVPMKDESGGEETSSTEETRPQDPPIKVRMSPAAVNGIKRKRGSRPTSHQMQPSIKRTRREGLTASGHNEQDSSAVSDEENSSDVETDPGTDSSRDSRPISQDVPMKDGQDGAISPQSESQESESEDNGSPVGAKVNGRPNDASAAFGKVSLISANAKQSSIAESSRSRNANLPVRRQSSLDDFVQRSEHVAAPTRPSPNTSNAATVKVTERNRLPKRSRKQNNHHEDVETGKGKERAQESEEGEEEESSAAQAGPPQAAPVAQKSSSRNSKGQTKPRRSKRGPRNTAPGASGSDADDSEKESVPGKEQASKPRESGLSAKGRKAGHTGRFTDEEVSILFSWRDGFCVEHSMDHADFNEMMTTSIEKGGRWPYKFITKKEFLQDYYDQLPYRNRRSMTRFRERHFQNVNHKPWNEEEDEELRSLVAQLGTKWVEIGKLMERTQDQVSQRWRHKLNYGQDVQTGEWSVEELQRLEEVVEAYAESKNTTVDDDTLVIPWHAISVKIGNSRSAQQCSNRWRVSTSRRIGGKFVKLAPEDRLSGSVKKTPKPSNKVAIRLSGDTGRKTKINPATKPKSRPKPKTPRKSLPPKKQYKSEERIMDSSDDEGDEVVENRPAEDEPEIPESAQRAPDGSDEEHSSDDDEAEQESGENDESEIVGPKQDDKTGSRRAKGFGKLPVEDVDTMAHDNSDAPSSQENSKDPATAHARSSQRGKPTSSQSQSQSGSISQPQPPTQKSTRTPAIPKNPLRHTKTPSQTQGLGLTQLHAATQASASASPGRNKSSVRSRVPDSVAMEERPSPRLLVRQRPVSSPLVRAHEHGGDSHVSASSDSDAKLGDDASGNEASGSGPESGSSSGEVSASASDEDEDKQAAEEKEHESKASHGMFWQSVNMLRNLVPGSSAGSPAPGKALGQIQRRKRTLADALTSDAVEDSDSRSDGSD